MSTVYRTVNTSFWTDPKIKNLAPECKLLMLYLITCPHTNVGGIYYVPDIVVLHETGLKKTTLDTLWDTLSRLGVVLRDRKSEVVWVVNMLKYQGRGKKVFAAAATQLLNLHNSHLVKKFLQRYPAVQSFYDDKVSHRVSDTPSEFGNPDMDNDSDSDQESEKEKGPGSPQTFADVLIPEELDTHIARAALDKWLAYKRKKRQPYASPSFIETKLREFIPHGAAAFVAAVDSSIGNNWDGVFTPKDRRNGPSQQSAGKQFTEGATCDFA